MRPPSQIASAWIKAKCPFSERGLVMLFEPGYGWNINIEITPVSREQLTTMSAEVAAFEIALSAVFCDVTINPYLGESIGVTTSSGSELLVPKIAFEMAPFVVEKVKKNAARRRRLRVAISGRPNTKKACTRPHRYS